MARNCIHVVLINPAGNLVNRSKEWGDAVGGSGGIENFIRSGLQVIAVYVHKDIDNGQGGFWDRYAQNSMYAVQESFEGISIAQHDITPEATSIRETLNDSSLRPQRPISAKLRGPTMGKGANWDVYEDGQGQLYLDKLAEADALVGYPG